MADKPTYTDPSFQEIENYFSGKLLPEEMHALEKRAHTDPFLADAMEGYYTQQKNWDALRKENDRILTALSPKMEHEKPKLFFSQPWLRVAAIFIFMALTGATAWYMFRQNHVQELAKNTEPVKVKTDTLLSPKDSSFIAPTIIADNRKTGEKKPMKDNPATTSVKEKDGHQETVKPASVLASADEANTDGQENPVPSNMAKKANIHPQKALMENNVITAPAPVAGWDAFHQYIKNSLPASRKTLGKKFVPGEVSLRFLINEKGETSRFQIEKSLSPAMDSLAIRLVREGPKWQADSSSTEGNVNLHFE